MKQIIIVIITLLSFGNMNAQSEIKLNQKKDTYALVVAFISKGSGIDYKSKEKIDAFIKNFHKKVEFEVCRMGREGETNYLFHLKELKEHEKKKFIKELKEQILDKEMVHIEENKLFESPCRG
jgi:hypothetical protein